MMKNISYALFALSLMVALVSCSKNKYDADATGAFEATEITVSSEVSGKILQFDMTEGAHMNKDTHVGTIDSTQIYLQKMSLLANARGVRAQRPSIDTQTAVLERQIETLKQEKERTQKLIDANAANQKQMDDIVAQIDVLEKQLSAQTSSLQRSNLSISEQSTAIDIQIAQLDNQLEKCKIVVPISGTILNKYAEAGELTHPGAPLFKIANLETMFLRAYVTNDQLARVRLNDSVKVLIDNGEGKMKQYAGVVTWISDKSEFTPKTIQTKNARANLVYAIKVAVKNDGYLKIGTYGEVVFNDAQK